MDSEEIPQRSFHLVVLRICVVLLFPIFTFCFLSFLVGLVTVFLGELSISAPISVLSQCKIVSSTVDLRSSKVCELGLLNYQAKHVLYPFERSKFRCHYDYYWASVFKVEYKDHLVGQKRLALAESPNEALPLDCRPDFGAAFLTKDKFKVNETYDCWYTSGIQKIRLHSDGFFNCQRKDPSILEMIRLYSILFTKILYSWSTSKGRAKYWRWELVAGVITGFSTSLVTIIMFRILQQMKFWFPRACPASIFVQVVTTARIKRTCFFVVYFSAVGWLATQYWKKLSIKDFQHVITK